MATYGTHFASGQDEGEQLHQCASDTLLDAVQLRCEDIAKRQWMDFQNDTTLCVGTRLESK